MHHGRLVQPNAAGVLHDHQHAQTHQRIGQIGVLVFWINGIATGAFGAFQMIPDVLDGLPLVFGVLNTRLCYALISAGNLW